MAPCGACALRCAGAPAAVLRVSAGPARVWVVVDLYNFVLPHKSLRQQGQPRTPAMAIGVAERVWSSRDYSWHPVHPDPLGRQLMQQRVKHLLTPTLATG
jgi:hypothetical protein